MEILVCVKQVPDDSVEVHLTDEGKPDLSNITPVVNAFDTYALEMAARLKEAREGEITALCIGGEEARNSLKNCLAVGADHAYLVREDQFDGSDSRGISHILMCAAKKIEEDTGKKFDLIFCGKEATDAALGQTGVSLSEMFGIGAVTNVIEVDCSEGRVTAKQETEEGYRLIETAAPCVLTVTKPDYDPRYPTIKNKMAARKKPIGTLKAEDLTMLEPEKTGEAGAFVKTLKLYEPPKKEAGIKIQEETAKDSALKAVAMMVDAKVF